MPGKLNTVTDVLSCAEYHWVLPDEQEFRTRTEDLQFDLQQQQQY